jgi:4-amino-4-deoxy-L-arabinose transferase-like glycosyltransferase
VRGAARGPLIVAGALLVAALLAGFAVYRFGPATWTVDIGGPFSGALVEGFQADEAEQAGRYRWSAGHSAIDLPDLGAGYPVVARLRVAPRPAGAPVVPFTVTVDSRVVATYTLPVAETTFSTPPIARASGAGGIRLAIDVPPFRAAGDARELGLKLRTVQIAPAPGAPAPLPPLAPLLALAAVALGAYAALERATRRLWAGAVGGALAGGLVVAGLATVRPLLTPWLLALGALVGGIGLLALSAPALAAWPRVVDGMAGRRSILPPLLLGALLVGYAAFALSVIPAVDWIGHADYAENAVVARNLAAGRGPVVDYVAQFYRAWPGITHPAETWPLLQPLLTAPFFLLLGAQTWVAKLPNLVLLLALAGAVYGFAARWWDRRVALLGAALTLLHPYFFQTTLYPISDLAFTLFALLTLGWAWEALEAHVAHTRQRVALGAEEDPDLLRAERAAIHRAPAPATRPPARRLAILAGAAAGLLVWSKGPSAALVLVGLAAALLWGWQSARWAGRRPPRDLRPLLWAVGAFAITLAPLLAWNLLTFHAPFYSTEQTDLWILRFYTGSGGLPWENIYANYLDGRPLPDRALLLRSYDALYSAVLWGFGKLWTGGVLNGDILDLPVVLAGAAGWLLAPRRLRGLAVAWVGAFLVYGLFVLLAWHYEERYFLALVPWFYLGTAALLFWIWDRLRGRAVGDEEWRATIARWRKPRDAPAAVAATGAAPRGGAALLILPLAVAGLVAPMVSAIGARAASDVGPNSFATAGRWAAANLPAGAVVMTRNPWEFNWYAQRKAVMSPEGTITDTLQIIQRYGVTYLWLGGAGDSTSPRVTPYREQLLPLYRRQPLPALPATLIYDADGVLIYRLER